MDALSFVVGIGIFCFILAHIAFNLEKPHIFLKIFLILIAIINLLFLPKLMLDEKDYCELVVANSTNIPAENKIHYEYGRVCFTNNYATTNIFFKSTLFIQGFVLMYVFIFYLYWWFYNKKLLPPMIRKLHQKFKKK